MNKPRTIIVACGGTGGHIYPGLATAQFLRQQGHQVILYLSGRDIENATRDDWGTDNIIRTGARPLTLRNAFANLLACWRCLLHMTRTKPDALLAMGGYTCLAPVLTARLLHVPIILHEANAVAGKAILFLSRFADYTALSFRESAREFTRCKTIWTGLPIRANLSDKEPLPNYLRTSDAFTLLITGGSQGAHRVNELVSEALLILAQELPNLRVIHQCGVADETTLADTYRTAGIKASVQAFISDMGRAYASADCVIARAGAATCFELAALGLPAILIPLPTALRDHQTANADALAKVGGVLLLQQMTLTPEKLADAISRLARHPEQRETMRQALLAHAQPDALNRLADLVLNAAAQRDVL